MSEHSMNEGRDRETRAALAALERMEAAGTDADVVSGTEDILVREYLELLGALPYALDPVTPSAGVKTRILAELGSPDAAAAPASPAATVPSNVVTMTPRAVSPAPRSNVWLGALAAALALCLLGLGYLGGRLSEQTRALARLEAIEPAGGPELVALQEELSTMKRRFHMVTSIARKAYPMEGVEPVGSQSRPAEGMVYVCGYHQRWYLNLQGLEPPPAGKAYNLWFLTEDGMVNGGAIDVRADATSEKEAQSMPEGTRGFAISLEQAGTHDAPEGIMVLLSEEAVSL